MSILRTIHGKAHDKAVPGRPRHAFRTHAA